ncbi:unnamed protein product [Urochloa decumbens]|uniref:Uncharacterized protein n=1 Tax=Urochloa decumbens TaxID=240449 RepID=A0ABC9EJZ0_9POAL
MEAPKASLAENPVTGAVPSDDDAKPPVMVVLERANDRTWVATPDYGDGDAEDDEQTQPPRVVVPDGGHHGNVVDVLSYRAHKVRLARWALACTIIDFKFDVKELIHDYISIGSDPHAKRERMLAMFCGEDERGRNMLTLPFVGLLDHQEAPVDEAAAELLLQQDADEGGDAGGEEEGSLRLRFVKKELSAAGFVDARHMRMSIEAFFDGHIDVDDEDADNETLKCFRACFMFATGFVNRLWDVRRIVEAYMDEVLDLEERREAIERKLRELEEVLDARARAVSTGRIKLIQ